MRLRHAAPRRTTGSRRPALLTWLRSLGPMPQDPGTRNACLRCVRLARQRPVLGSGHQAQRISQVRRVAVHVPVEIHCGDRILGEEPSDVGVVPAGSRVPGSTSTSSTEPSPPNWATTLGATSNATILGRMPPAAGPTSRPAPKISQTEGGRTPPNWTEQAPGGDPSAGAETATGGRFRANRTRRGVAQLG